MNKQIKLSQLHQSQGRQGYASGGYTQHGSIYSQQSLGHTIYHPPPIPASTLRDKIPLPSSVSSLDLTALIPLIETQLPQLNRDDQTWLISQIKAGTVTWQDLGVTSSNSLGRHQTHSRHQTHNTPTIQDDKNNKMSSRQNSSSGHKVSNNRNNENRNHNTSRSIGRMGSVVSPKAQKQPFWGQLKMPQEISPAFFNQMKIRLRKIVAQAKNNHLEKFLKMSLEHRHSNSRRKELTGIKSSQNKVVIGHKKIMSMNNDSTVLTAKNINTMNASFNKSIGTQNANSLLNATSVIEGKSNHQAKKLVMKGKGTTEMSHKPQSFYRNKRSESTTGLLAATKNSKVSSQADTSMAISPINGFTPIGSTQVSRKNSTVRHEWFHTTQYLNVQATKEKSLNRQSKSKSKTNKHSVPRYSCASLMNKLQNINRSILHSSKDFRQSMKSPKNTVPHKNHLSFDRSDMPSKQSNNSACRQNQTSSDVHQNPVGNKRAFSKGKSSSMNKLLASQQSKRVVSFNQTFMPQFQKTQKFPKQINQLVEKDRIDVAAYASNPNLSYQNTQQKKKTFGDETEQLSIRQTSKEQQNQQSQLKQQFSEKSVATCTVFTLPSQCNSVSNENDDGIACAEIAASKGVNYSQNNNTKSNSQSNKSKSSVNSIQNKNVPNSLHNKSNNHSQQSPPQPQNRPSENSKNTPSMEVRDWQHNIGKDFEASSRHDRTDQFLFSDGYYSPQSYEQQSIAKQSESIFAFANIANNTNGSKINFNKGLEGCNNNQLAYENCNQHPCDINEIEKIVQDKTMTNHITKYSPICLTPLHSLQEAYIRYTNGRSTLITPNESLLLTPVDCSQNYKTQNYAGTEDQYLMTTNQKEYKGQSVTAYDDRSRTNSTTNCNQTTITKIVPQKLTLPQLTNNNCDVFTCVSPTFYIPTQFQSVGNGNDGNNTSIHNSATPSNNLFTSPQLLNQCRNFLKTRTTNSNPSIIQSANWANQIESNSSQLNITYHTNASNKLVEFQKNKKNNGRISNNKAIYLLDESNKEQFGIINNNNSNSVQPVINTTPKTTHPKPNIAQSQNKQTVNPPSAQNNLYKTPNQSPTTPKNPLQQPRIQIFSLLDLTNSNQLSQTDLINFLNQLEQSQLDISIILSIKHCLWDVYDKCLNIVDPTGKNNKLVRIGRNIWESQRSQQTYKELQNILGQFEFQVELDVKQ